MSISSTTNQPSSSSSIAESQSESSPFRSGYEVFSPEDRRRISDSPHFPPRQGFIPGEVVSAQGVSLESSEEVRKKKDNGRISTSSHPETTSHRKGVERLKVGSPEQRDIASGTNVSSKSDQAGSGNIPGRKAQMVNGNHLLNFQYDPIPVSRPRTRPHPQKPKWVKPYNKDLFFQANYKFVVLDTGNYDAESLNPDKMLSWEDIICLKYSSPSPVSCPVCLDPPLCPQITSCGHIFCFPCILQYFYIHNDDPKDECWKKCPLCSTMISSKDLYTVRIEKVKQYRVGDEIEFALLSRLRGSFNSYVRDCDGDNLEDGFVNSFAKFSFTSDVNLSVREAMSDLDSWIAKADSGLVDDDIERLPYVSAAMEQLEQRKRYWGKRCFLIINEETTSSCGSACSLSGTALSSPVAVKTDWLHKSSRDEALSTQLSSSPNEGSTHYPENPEKSSSYEDNKCSWLPSSEINERAEGFSYNYYQAIDGQHVILHPLNMKCLLHHFGSPDKLPGRIKGRILELESVTQSEAMRRRYRFLSHFSLTTTFQLCEINLGHLLPAESLFPFLDEVNNREKQRKRVARKIRKLQPEFAKRVASRGQRYYWFESVQCHVTVYSYLKESKEKLKAEAAANQFSLEPYYSRYDAAPSYSMDDFEALGSGSADVVVAASSSSSRWPAAQSFSSVARLGFASAHDSPALRNSQEASSSVSSTSSESRNKVSFASVLSGSQPASASRSHAGKKGKRAARLLLSTAGGRRN